MTDAAAVDPTEIVFDLTVLHEIDITVEEQYLQQLDDDRENRVPCTITFDGVTLTNVGIRQKGGFGSVSNLAGKPGFSVKFDEFEDLELHGLDKLILNNSVQDPSFLHEHLGYYVYRQAGIPAHRTSHGIVTLNGFTYGIYVINEAVEKKFLRRYLGDGNNDGNLYEGECCGDFVWDPDRLDLKKEIEEMRSRQDSYDFAAVIRDTPDNQFEDTVRPLLDLDGFITGFAIDGITQTGLGETCDGPDCLPDCSGVAVCAEVPGTVGTIVACPQSRDIWQALEDCEMRGGTLAAPIDAAENSLIIATAFGVFDEGYWIGIHDSITEGTWQKIDGSPVTFTAWAPGRPNGGGGQNCAIIDNGLGGGWNDRACWERHGFICRVP